MLIDLGQLHDVPTKLLQQKERQSGASRPTPTRTVATKDAYFESAKSSLEIIRGSTNLDCINEITCEDIERWVEAKRTSYPVNFLRDARESLAVFRKELFLSRSESLEQYGRPDLWGGDQHCYFARSRQPLHVSLVYRRCSGKWQRWWIVVSGSRISIAKSFFKGHAVTMSLAAGVC